MEQSRGRKDRTRGGGGEGDGLFRHPVTVTENRIHAKAIMCVKAKNSLCTGTDTAVVCVFYWVPLLHVGTEPSFRSHFAHVPQTQKFVVALLTAACSLVLSYLRWYSDFTKTVPLQPQHFSFQRSYRLLSLLLLLL